MLVQVRVCDHLEPLARVSMGSTYVQMFVCSPVGLFYGKPSPCCLGLVCAGAILSCSRDCNEWLAAHQALSLGPGFPGRSLGPVYVWRGCSLALGNALGFGREPGAHSSMHRANGGPQLLLEESAVG